MLNLNFHLLLFVLWLGYYLFVHMFQENNRSDFSLLEYYLRLLGSLYSNLLHAVLFVADWCSISCLSQNHHYVIVKALYPLLLIVSYKVRLSHYHIIRLRYAELVGELIVCLLTRLVVEPACYFYGFHKIGCGLARIHRAFPQFTALFN